MYAVAQLGAVGKTRMFERSHWTEAKENIEFVDGVLSMVVTNRSPPPPLTLLFSFLANAYRHTHIRCAFALPANDMVRRRKSEENEKKKRQKNSPVPPDNMLFFSFSLCGCVCMDVDVCLSVCVFVKKNDNKVLASSQVSSRMCVSRVTS